MSLDYVRLKEQERAAAVERAEKAEAERDEALALLAHRDAAVNQARAEVERLTVVLDQMTIERDHHAARADRYHDEREGSRDDVERLKAELDEARGALRRLSTWPESTPEHRSITSQDIPMRAFARAVLAKGKP